MTKIEPPAELRHLAATAMQLFVAFCDEGFDEVQALECVKEMLPTWGAE